MKLRTTPLTTIRTMKHFVLFILFVLFPGIVVKAQEPRAKEIVGAALKKHTSGKLLNQFELSVVYDKPGTAPSSLIQPNPFLLLIDSLVVAMPDSQRKEMEVLRVEMQKEMFKDFDEMYAGTKEIYYVDVAAKLNARIFISPSPAKGRPDTTRQIYSLEKENSFSHDLEVNPVSLLRLMAMDTSELHYTGKITFENIDYTVVQVKIGVKWWDVYFDQKTGIVCKLIIPQIDTDPLIGKGTVYSKNIFCYSEFRDIEGFLLPEKIEVIDTRQELTLRKKLRWTNINKSFPASAFDSGPSYIERAKYNISPISDSLFVLEQSGIYENRRSLLRINHKGEIDMFTDLPNLEKFNESEYELIKSKLKGHALKNIYNLKNHTSLTALSCYFSQNIHIIAPKGTGIFSDENSSYNPKEDSMRLGVRSQGLLTSFDKESQNGEVAILILNPIRDYENDNIWVSYYLPKEKIIYFDGNPYSAQSSSKNARKTEKLIYDIIKHKSLNIEKIVYSGAYLENAPLFMTFKDFETRIKNTDFSIYDRNKK